jgi:hypothetical protein
MNKTTIFKTPSGDEMVVMPRALYDKLVNGAEMAQDIAAYSQGTDRSWRRRIDPIQKLLTAFLMAKTKFMSGANIAAYRTGSWRRKSETVPPTCPISRTAKRKVECRQ